MTNKRKLFVTVLVFALTLVVGVGTVSGQSAPDCSQVSYAGDGTEQNPYEVGNIDQLQCMEDKGLDANYVQVSNIDASETSQWNSGKGFNPISLNSQRFNGSFNGQDYNISDLTINRVSNPVGLFGSTGPSGEVTNVSVLNINISGGDNVGGLTGANLGSVANSVATGNVTASGIRTGGLVGANTGTVRDSHAAVKVNGSAAVGGLIGENRGLFFVGVVHDSYATGEVSGDNGVGGLVGANVGAVNESYATGEVSGDNGVGGLVGTNNGAVNESYSTADVSSSGFHVGGLVGSNTPTPHEDAVVSGSYATGSVNGPDIVGGLIGKNNGTVTSSYATGPVNGSDRVGGLVGLHTFGAVSESYATGNVTGSSNTGGLVGGAYSTSVTDSYWDLDTTGQSDSEGGMGLATSEMTGSVAESNMQGFDFADTWDAVTNPDDYPVLQWQTGRTGGNSPPTASFLFNPSSPSVGETVNFDAADSLDTDGSIRKYEWNFNGDGTTDAMGLSVTNSFPGPGEYTVTLTVTDDDGATDTTTETVSVTDSNSGITVTASDTTASPGGEATVDITAEEVGSVTLSNIRTSWSVVSSQNGGAFVAPDGNGDNIGSSGNVLWAWSSDQPIIDISVTLDVPDNSQVSDYTLTAEAEDADGNTVTDTATVTVEDCPASPTVCNYDPDGDIDTGDLQDAINDFIQGDLDTGGLQDVINAFIAS